MVDELDNGQLNVKLDSIKEMLVDLRSNMITKDVFDVWAARNDDRVRRIEDDVKKWVAESTAVHVQLEAESKARHEQSINAVATLRVELNNKIERSRTAIEERFQKQDDLNNQVERDQKTMRSNRVVTYSVLALTVVSSILTPIIVTAISQQVFGTG